MLIIGLTGSIGMGKTTVAAHMASRGVPVLDSDGTVHRLYEGDAVPHVEAAFPGTTADGKVDRAKLAAAAMQATDGFARLEALIHPLVRQAQWRFLQEQRGRRCRHVRARHSAAVRDRRRPAGGRHRRGQRAGTHPDARASCPAPA